jgi:hypothetical protein
MRTTITRLAAHTKVTLVACVAALGMIGVGRAQDVRQIAADNLWYPALISLGPVSGSGFFLRADRNVTFVTAAHLIFNQAGALIAQNATLETPSRDLSEAAKTVYHVDLAAMQNSGDLRIDRVHDVVVIRVGTIVNGPTEKGQGTVRPIAGVTLTSTANGGIVIVSPDAVERFNRAVVGSQVILFGYPGPMGVVNVPQIDFSRPLLRTGIIAGTNVTQQTIILDVSINPGNSGGPVLQATADGHFRLIGVVIQLVPALQEIGLGQRMISNSGYAIAASMDAVMDLAAMIPQPQ